jgi:ATP-dependent DNA helicase RecG
MVLGGAVPLAVVDDVDRRIRSFFSFPFTSGQNRAVTEIRSDLASSTPMNRLLQGDVGCGKTAVAFYAMLVAAAAGVQTVLMVPTEILCRQHAAALEELLSSSERNRVRVAVLVGGLSQGERKGLLTAVAGGAVDILIATHAAFQKDVVFRNLQLIVIDEQHKFGVAQRQALVEKASSPHVLVMTATPIPRSLAMTLYGDLDVSVIDTMPPGRKPVITRVPQREKTPLVFDYLRRKLREGRQIYIVSPLVAESENLDLKSAEEAFDELRQGPFGDYRVGLLHGQMERERQVEVIDAFRTGSLDVLVSTVVIEVGVNIPNATVLVVLHAERFGLAQLHQLRGRVARGSHQGVCVLLSDTPNPGGHERLMVLAEETDGFKIAEEDLRLRGSGDLLGTRQHGNPLRLADLIEDRETMQSARAEATRLLSLDPSLVQEEHVALREALFREHGERLALASV